jgi:hypothetical protein
MQPQQQQQQHQQQPQVLRNLQWEFNILQLLPEGIERQRIVLNDNFEHMPKLKNKKYKN